MNLSRELLRTRFLQCEDREGEGNQSKGVKKRQARRKSTLEMTSQSFCHFVLIRNESLGLLHIQEEINTHKGQAYQKVEITGSHFRSCLPLGVRKRRHCSISKIRENEKRPGLEFCFGC